MTVVTAKVKGQQT